MGRLTANTGHAEEENMRIIYSWEDDEDIGYPFRLNFILDLRELLMRYIILDKGCDCIVWKNVFWYLFRKCLWGYPKLGFS